MNFTKKWITIKKSIAFNTHTKTIEKHNEEVIGDPGQTLEKLQEYLESYAFLQICDSLDIMLHDAAMALDMLEKIKGIFPEINLLPQYYKLFTTPKNQEEHEYLDHLGMAYGLQYDKSNDPVGNYALQVICPPNINIFALKNLLQNQKFETKFMTHYGVELFKILKKDCCVHSVIKNNGTTYTITYDQNKKMIVHSNKI